MDIIGLRFSVMYVIHWGGADRVNLSPAVDNLCAEVLLNHSNILWNEISGHFDGYDVSVCFGCYTPFKFCCLHKFTAHQFGVICAIVINFYKNVKRKRYIMSRRLGGPQGQVGGVRKNSPLQGFDPQTVQRIVSSYTGYVVTVKYRFLYKSHLPALVQFV